MRNIKYVSPVTGKQIVRKPVKVLAFDNTVVLSPAQTDDLMLAAGFVRKNRKGKNRKSNQRTVKGTKQK